MSDQRGSKVERADGQQSASDHCVWSLIVGAVLFHFLVRPSATSTYPIDETAGAASAARADELSPSRPIPVAVVAPLEQVLRGDELPARGMRTRRVRDLLRGGRSTLAKQSSTGPSAAACQSIAFAPRSTGDIKQQRNGGANAYQ